MVRDAPARADARRNRDRILTAAADVFARRGLDATLTDVARHAGLGVATVYRNFANKDELIRSMFVDRLDEALARAEEAAASTDAWAGLVAYLEYSLSAKRHDRALAQLLTSPAVGQDLADQARDRLGAMVNALVRRAQEQGTVRADLAGTDTVFLEVGLDAVMDRTRDVAPDLYRRLLTIFLDGIRAGRATTPLLPEALSTEMTHDVIVGHR
jgi:AcrR family transcriptional regulator